MPWNDIHNRTGETFPMRLSLAVNLSDRTIDGTGEIQGRIDSVTDTEIKFSCERHSTVHLAGGTGEC
jgi:hypothetical protein